MALLCLHLYAFAAGIAVYPPEDSVLSREVEPSGLSDQDNDDVVSSSGEESPAGLSLGDPPQKTPRDFFTNQDAIKVSITWIRHALSCANVNDQYSKKNKAVHAHAKIVNAGSMVDPPLSNFGVKASKEVGDHRESLGIPGLEAFDFVGSSVLLRAVETAALQFPEYLIHVVPFVSEEGYIFTENTADILSQHTKMNSLPSATGDPDYKQPSAPDYTHWNKAQEISRTMHPQNVAGNLAGMVHKIGGFGARPSSDSQRLKRLFSDPRKPDMSNALRYLAREVVKSFIQRAEVGIDGVIKLAIVSHSNFLRGALPCKDIWTADGRTKPENNEALTMQYVWTQDELGPNLVADEESCVRTNKGVPPPTKEQGICPEEYSRCVGTYGQSMMIVDAPRNVSGCVDRYVTHASIGSRLTAWMPRKPVHDRAERELGSPGIEMRSPPGFDSDDSESLEVDPMRV